MWARRWLVLFEGYVLLPGALSEVEATRDTIAHEAGKHAR
jgi:hypothetical protein